VNSGDAFGKKLKLAKTYAAHQTFRRQSMAQRREVARSNLEARIRKKHSSKTTSKTTSDSNSNSNDTNTNSSTNKV
jgi:hypothetical protein